MRGGTALYDAVLLASDELMKKQEGRKALVILTDGVDTASMVTLEESEESAQRADTLVYSVLFEDPDAYGGGFGGSADSEAERQKRPERHFAPDRRPAAERIQETHARTGVRLDRGRAAEHVQPGLYSRPRGQRRELPQDPPDYERKGHGGADAGRVLCGVKEAFSYQPSAKPKLWSSRSHRT